MNVCKYIVLISFVFYSMKSFAQAGYIIRFDGEKTQLNTLVQRQGDFILQDHIPFTNIYLLNEKPNRRVGKAKISDFSSKAEWILRCVEKLTKKDPRCKGYLSQEAL